MRPEVGGLEETQSLLLGCYYWCWTGVVGHHDRDRDRGDRDLDGDGDGDVDGGHGGNDDE